MRAAAFSLFSAIVLVALAACGDAGTSESPAQPVPDGSTPPGSDASASADVPSLPGGWAARASLAFAKQELAVLALQDRVWVLGGFDGTKQVLAGVDVYDPASDSWSTRAPLPEPLHHINAAVVDGKIWIAGALRGSAFVATGVTAVYDPVANAWTQKAPMPAGSERGAALVAAIGPVIYVAGGFRGGAVTDMSSYDTRTDTWTPLAPLDQARDHGAAVVIGDVLYAVAGRNTAHFPRLDAYDAKTGTWTPRAPMPTSRAGIAVAVAKGRIVVMGGEGNDAVSSGVFQQVEAYDPATNTWSSLPPMKTPRHGTGAATVNDVVYVPGGGITQGFGATEVVEALTF
jgi:N-acetylneuraminic acid mutarotase